MKVQKTKVMYYKEKSNRNEKSNIENVFNAGKFSLALKYIKEYLIKYPRDLNAWTNYGKLLRLLKNNELALEVLTI